MAKQWRRANESGEPWSDPQFVVVVLNNRDLNYVTWEQRAMDGDPRYVTSQALPDLPYADFSRPQGLQYFLGHLRFFHPLREVTRRGMTYGVQPEVNDLKGDAGLLL